jgi:hypothetical protein
MPRAIDRVQLRLGLDCVLKLRYAREGLAQRESREESEVFAASLAMVAERHWASVRCDVDARRLRAGQAVSAVADAVARARSGGAPVRIRDLPLQVDGLSVRVGEVVISPDRWEVAEIVMKRLPDDASAMMRRDERAVLLEWRPAILDVAISREIAARWIAQNAQRIGVGPGVPVAAALVGLRDVEDTGAVGSGDALLRRLPVDALLGFALGTDGAAGASGRGASIDSLRQVASTRQWPAPERCVSVRCKQCEFFVPGDPESGFARCWGWDAVFRADHVLNLHRLTDPQLQSAIDKDGLGATIGSIAPGLARPSQQASFTAHEGAVTVSDELSDWARVRREGEFDRSGRSTHPSGPSFLSVSMAQVPLPAWPGARAFEQVPFHFAAHRLPSESSALVERVSLPGFSRCDLADPRRAFAQSLREQLGDEGAVYHWHHLVRVVVRGLRDAFAAETQQPGDAGLVDFLTGLYGTDAQPGRLVDLMPVATGYQPPIAGFPRALRGFTRHAWKYGRISDAFRPGQSAPGDRVTYDDPVDPARSLPMPPPRPSDGIAAPRRVPMGPVDPWVPQRLWLECHTGRRQDFDDVHAFLRAWGHLQSASVLMAHHFLVHVAPALARQAADRTVRVFVSSTFRDFGEERSLLKRQVEPALNRRAIDRMVQATVVDLRWGITDEQAGRGLALPLCLHEVERCRPYFVGLLGQRYGWVPAAQHYPEDLVSRMPWLREHVGGSSMTELEIRHGTLEAKISPDDAHFYFRDPQYAAGKGGDFLSDGAEEVRKLEGLKQAIRARGFPVTEDYRDPPSFADQVTADLWAKIDRAYPRDLVGDAALADWTAHQAHAARLTRHFQADEGELRAIRSFLAESAVGRVAIVGPTGCGKSAVLAKAVEYLVGSERAVVVHHFVGVGATAARMPDICGRLAEVSRTLLAVPAGDPAFAVAADSEAMLRALGAAAMARGAILILAIDGLDAAEGVEGLAWLRCDPPPGVKLFMTGLPNGAVARAPGRRRGSRRIRLKPLDARRARPMIESVLARNGRALPSAVIDEILAHPCAGVPGFLQALLDELMVSADHAGLVDRVRECLAPRTLAGLHRLVLRRIESGLGADFVGSAMRILADAGSGLAEPDLVAMLGGRHAELTSLRLQVGSQLIDAGGRISLPPGAFANAVCSRYGSAGKW